MLEVEIYPGFLDRRDYSRTLKTQRAVAAQKKQNEKNAARKLARIIHANFVPGDIAFTAGYSNDRQPTSLDACKKDVVRFFDRLKYHSGKAGAGDIKYVYVIEQKTTADGVTKYHVHMIMSLNAGENTCVAKKRPDGTKEYIPASRNKDPKAKPIPERDWIEFQWKGGDYDNTKSLQWKRGGGFTGISKYITKQFEQLHDTEHAGLRHWGQSLGLKKWSKPPKASYGRFRKRKVMELVKAPATIKSAFEKEFPGYGYLEDYPCEIRYSDVIEGFYLYCRMYKKE